MKFATVPLSVVGKLVTVVAELNVSAGEPTVTVELFALSLPLQLPCLGVTEYLQSPGGTACSTQLKAETVAEHPDSTVCDCPLGL
jgi:hypothetical protein